MNADALAAVDPVLVQSDAAAGTDYLGDDHVAAFRASAERAHTALPLRFFVALSVSVSANGRCTVGPRSRSPSLPVRGTRDGGDDDSDVPQAPHETPEKDPQDWTTGEEPMTDPQRSYLQLTGGEPTIDRLFPEVYTLAWDFGMMITVSFNVRLRVAVLRSALAAMGHQESVEDVPAGQADH